MDSNNRGSFEPPCPIAANDLEVSDVSASKSVPPEKLSGALVKFWPILAASLVLAASVGGGWVRLSSVETRLAIHERYFRSVAVNQYLMCRVLNKSVADKDERLKCEYPEE